MKQATTFIGLDVHKAAIAVAIADGGCRHAARYLGEIPNTAEALSRLVRKPLAGRVIRGQRVGRRSGDCHKTPSPRAAHRPARSGPAPAGG